MTFSIKEAFKKGWGITKENIFLLAGLTSLIALNSWIAETWWKGMDKSIDSSQFSTYLIFLALYLVTSIVSTLVQIGYIKVMFKLYEGEEINPRDVFAHYERLWDFIVISFLYGIVVLFGAVLFIIPGIIFAIKYGYASYFVVCHDMKPLEAMKASARITKGNKTQIALFGACILGLNIIGFLVFGIGFLITMPLTTLASVHVFKILNKEDEFQQELPLNEEK